MEKSNFFYKTIDTFEVKCNIILNTSMILFRYSTLPMSWKTIQKKMFGNSAEIPQELPETHPSSADLMFKPLLNCFPVGSIKHNQMRSENIPQSFSKTTLLS